MKLKTPEGFQPQMLVDLKSHSVAAKYWLESLYFDKRGLPHKPKDYMASERRQNMGFTPYLKQKNGLFFT